MDWVAWLEFLGPWWQRWEHLVVAVAIIGAVSFLNLERQKLQAAMEKLQAAIDTLGQEVEAFEELIEQGVMPSGPAATAENWEQIRVMWADMRGRMDDAIDEISSDGRKARKYSTLPRNNYKEIISNLGRDLGLSSDVEDLLQEMNDGFLALRRSRTATREQANLFWEAYQRADKALPKPIAAAA